MNSATVAISAAEPVPVSRPATIAETYNDKVVRQFTIMTVVWGIVGMLVGALIAAELIWPTLNFGLPWLAYGRLRPLHTNAVIFAFGGCALMGTSFYVVQRTCHVRLFSDKLAAFVFWGWQAVIGLAIISLPMGWTTAKEYAELEWPIDILIAVAGSPTSSCTSERSRNGASRTSTSRTGSTAHSSSPPPCSTSSTARNCR